MYRPWSAVWSFEFRTEDSRSIFGPRFFAISSLNIKRFCMLELSNRITFLTKLARCLPTKETISSVPAIRSKSLLVNTYAQESSFLRYSPFTIFRRKDMWNVFCSFALLCSTMFGRSIAVYCVPMSLVFLFWFLYLYSCWRGFWRESSICILPHQFSILVLFDQY